MLETCIAILVVSNALTLFWALKYRKPFKSSKKLKALQQVIAAFEVEGQTILHIQKIRPDDVFLRNTSR